MNSSKTTNILLVIIGVLLALLVFVFFQSYQTNKEKQIIVTPQDQLGYTTPVKEVFSNKNVNTTNSHALPVNTTIPTTTVLPIQQNQLSIGNTTFSTLQSNVAVAPSKDEIGCYFVQVLGSSFGSDKICQGSYSSSFVPSGTYMSTKYFGNNKYDIFKLRDGSMYFLLVNSNNQAFSVVTGENMPQYIDLASVILK